MRRFLCITAALALTLGANGLGAQQTDVVRGKVSGPDSVPLAAVNVKVTSYQGGVSKMTTTDKNGRFTIILLNGEGDYWVELTKLGFAPKRFEVRKVGDEEVLMVDARMLSTIAQLDAVDVTAAANRNRQLPNRNALTADIGGGDQALNNAGVSADKAGNLAAMAATIAGIQLIPGLDGAPDVYSLLGLSGDQNNTTFDGLGSGINALPPDILATTSISPYPFDPSKGGFSAAQIAIQTMPGSNFSRRLMNSVNIAPPLEWADATASEQGQKYTNLRLGGNAAGPIAINSLFYNTAYNFSRRFSDVHSLLNTSPAGMAAAGVSPDSANRLVDVLGDQHIPTTGSAFPTLQAQDAAQLAANLDLMPSKSGTGHSFTFGGAGNYQRTQPVSRGSLLLSTPAHSGETSFWGANATIVHSNYFWFGILTKTTLGFAGSGSSSSPYELTPEGSVRVSSTLPDGSSSVKSLLFGGSSTESSLRNQAIQLNNQLSWYSDDNTHTIKVTSGITRDAFTSDFSSNTRGAFTFNSITDLETRHPASFTRTLGHATQSGSQLVGAASIGDYWRPTQGVQVQYGVRADANRFLSPPTANEDIIAAFNLSNATLPNRVYLSPRVGLQWYYGSAPTVAYAPGAARPPRAVIHAGAGVFQNMAPSQLVSGALASTGLPGSTQTITCVGTAVPFPDWSAFLTSDASIPTQCADGSAGTVFSTASPNVTLFDRSYRQQNSLRAAADWSGPVLDNRFVLGVQAIVSSGRDQQSAVDINFNPTVRFTLANESGRPVFADTNDIVPSTGAVATAGTRVSPQFQHVWSQRSDLELRATQFNVNLKPVTAKAMLRWDATYTFLDVRENYSGFASTAGNPYDVQWGPHLQAGRHAFQLAWRDFPVFDVVYISAALQLESGQLYTPMIAGDVNGDGVLNDRAFIADPSKTNDGALAAAMRTLLANATGSARDCLERQLNTLAVRGSCRAPWTAGGALGIKFNPEKIGLPKRATVSLQVQNPLALGDIALHGTNIRGWGQNIAPDQNLLYVRGFDPATREFRYDVNQRFGSTRPQQSATHALPFISLGVSLDVGQPRERQLLTQRLDMGRGNAATRQNSEALNSFATASIPNPMYLILTQSDSLKLTRIQGDSLAMLSRAYAQFADSVWTPVSRYLASLPNDYNSRDAYGRYVSARERTVDFLLTLVPDAKRVLTASQRRKLPPQIASFLDERVLKFLRSSTSGDASAAGR